MENLSLQDIHTDMVADEVLQLEAFARAITTGEGREWMHESTLGTWVLMEACNESARTGGRVDVGGVAGGGVGGVGGMPVARSYAPYGKSRERSMDLDVGS